MKLLDELPDSEEKESLLHRYHELWEQFEKIKEEDKTPPTDTDEVTIEFGQEMEIRANQTIWLGDTGSFIKTPHDLPENVTIKVSKVNDADIVKAATHLQLAGDVYTITLTPENLKTEGTFTLTFVYQTDDEEGLDIYYYDGKEWIKQGGEIDGDNRWITLEVPHFSTYGVFVSRDGTEPTEDEDDPSEEDETNGEDEDDESQGKDDEQLDNDKHGTDEQANDAKRDDGSGKGSTSSTDLQGKESGKKLPKTATNMYNWLIYGGALVALGLALILYRRFVLKKKA